MDTVASSPQIGTVWGLRQGVVLCCFRAWLAPDGRILRTTLGEADDHVPAADRDTEIAERLRRRYGADLDLRVIADGGASFERFQDDLRQQRRPTPPPVPDQGRRQGTLFAEP